MGVPSNRPAQAGWLRGLCAGRDRRDTSTRTHLGMCTRLD
jgi:hypothetical protein